MIDRLLVRNERANRRIASQFALTETALRRHRSAHLPAALAKAQAAQTVSHADELLAELEDLRARTEALLLQAEAAGDMKTALGAIRESRGNLELLARLLGEIQESATVNVLVSPEWQAIQRALATVLGPYPDVAREAAKALRELQGGPAVASGANGRARAARR